MPNTSIDCHPLLGRRLHSAALKNNEIQFEAQISPDAPEFLRDHCIYHRIIVPGTAYIEMALAAGNTIFKSDNLVLEEIANWQALILDENEIKTVQLVLTPEENLAYSYQIFSLLDSEKDTPSWTLHASGKLLLGDEKEVSTQPDLATLKAQYKEEMSIESHYQQFHERGMEYGPTFQGIKELRIHEGKALGKIQLAEELISELDGYRLHPALLDACFHVVEAPLTTRSEKDVYVPIKLERLRVYRHSGPLLWSWAQHRPNEDSSNETLTADVNLFDDNGNLVAQAEGLSLKRVNRETLLRTLEKDFNDLLYKIDWQPKPCENGILPSENAGDWLIFADHGGVGFKLASLLEEKGEHSILITPGQSYKIERENHYQINPAEPLDFQRLLQETTKENQSAFRGVIHLWSLEEEGSDITLTTLHNSQVIGCGSVLSLLQALPQVPRLLLVTRGTQPVGSNPTQLSVCQAPMWGIGRVIALEHPKLNCVCLDLDPSPTANDIQALFTELKSSDNEDQVAYRQGVRYIARLVRHTSPTLKGKERNDPSQLRIATDGIIENMALEPMNRRQPEAGEVEIQVHATGLNFRDVLTALGMLKEFQSATNPVFGFECAGTVADIGENVKDYKIGDEVMAKVNTGAFSSFVTVKTEFVVPKPEQFSFSEAATIPLAFLTAYYGLYTKAKMKAGDRILIHAAAGGVGQAAVQLAQLVGAEIFATASPGKWEFLKSLGIKHVMNSRTLDFAKEVMTLTEGQGVDIVLNSLNGEFIPKSFEALGKEGRFVEIGKLGIWDTSTVKDVRPDVSYFPFDLGDITKENPGLLATLFRELAEEFKKGSLKPLPCKVFSMENVVEAFRYMVQAKHIGKVVISQPEITLDVNSLNSELVQEDVSYLVTGGLGGLGLKVAEWLVAKGARYIVLTGRREPTSYAQESIQQLEEIGAKVLVVSADISLLDDVEQLLATVRTSMPPLKGIVHAAGVLDDGVLLQQNWKRFSKVMAPKVAGTWNLHTVTQEMVLDFFVCFSSAASMLGSPGQGNYAAANAFMDAITYYRQAQGLSGSSINWGPWAEVGMAAELSSQNKRRTLDQGWYLMPPEQGLWALGKSIQQKTPQMGVLPINWPRFIQKFSPGRESPLLSELASEVAQQASEEQSSVPQQEFLKQVQEAPVNDRQELLIGYLQERITKVIGLSSSQRPKPHQSLSELGFDSLMNMELRNWITTDLKVDVPVEKLMNESIITQLADILLEQLTWASVIVSNDAPTENLSDEMEEIAL